jgi:hypothetical protein
MKNTRNFFVSRVLPLVLLAVIALTVVSCGTQKDSQTGTQKTFTFEAYDLDGAKLYGGEITTTCATVGEALLEEGLVVGEDGPYGLYVQSVCGVVADYNTDATYWSFLIDGEYAMTGVDKTNIEDGKTYTFTRTK